MPNTLSKIDIETRIFGGYGRVIIFKDFTPDMVTNTTTYKDIFESGGQDCGKVIEGSGSWDGDDSEITTVKSTRGEVIRSFISSAGTHAWSCRVPHSAETVVVAGGRVHTLSETADVEAGGLKVKKDAKILGINPGDGDFKCAIGVLNLELNEIELNPRATISFSRATDDEDTREYNIKVVADSCETTNLDTTMFIPLAENPFEVASAGTGA